jgi:hypothetical protein
MFVDVADSVQIVSRDSVNLRWQPRLDFLATECLMARPDNMRTKVAKNFVRLSNPDTICIGWAFYGAVFGSRLNSHCHFPACLYSGSWPCSGAHGLPPMTDTLILRLQNPKPSISRSL